MTRNTTISTRNCCFLHIFSDDYFFVLVQCSDVECMLYCRHKYHTITMLAGSCRLNDCLHDSIDLIVWKHYFKLHPWQQVVSDWLTSPLQVELALLAPA